jgi:hypothetical protein
MILKSSFIEIVLDNNYVIMPVRHNPYAIIIYLFTLYYYN